MAQELKRLWKANPNIIQILLGVLATTRKSPKRAGTTLSMELLQKTALLAMSQIFRKILDTDSVTKKENVKIPRQRDVNRALSY